MESIKRPQVGDYIRSFNGKNVVLVKEIDSIHLIGELIETNNAAFWYAENIGEISNWAHPDDHNWKILKGYGTPLWKALNGHEE